VRLPEMQMHTTAFWLTVPEDAVEAQPVSRAVVLDILRGVASAMHLVAAVGLMCDPRDIGQTLGDRSEEDGAPSSDRGGPGFDPTIFLYDHVPGGVGLASRLFVERESLLIKTRALIDGCPCAEGCPACIGPSVTDQRLGSRKKLAVELLASLGVAALQ